MLRGVQHSKNANGKQVVRIHDDVIIASYQLTSTFDPAGPVGHWKFTKLSRSMLDVVLQPLGGVRIVV